uniref:Uncharacterized protein n=1 Tax=Anopheles dirus TaxID=7168 RepID=A0A182NWG9_9DIPT
MVVCNYSLISEFCRRTCAFLFQTALLTSVPSAE